MNWSTFVFVRDLQIIHMLQWGCKLFAIYYLLVVQMPHVFTLKPSCSKSSLNFIWNSKDELNHHSTQCLQNLRAQHWDSIFFFKCGPCVSGSISTNMSGKHPLIFMLPVSWCCLNFLFLVEWKHLTCQPQHNFLLFIDINDCWQCIWLHCCCRTSQFFFVYPKSLLVASSFHSVDKEKWIFTQFVCNSFENKMCHVLHWWWEPPLQMSGDELSCFWVSNFKSSLNIIQSF